MLYRVLLTNIPTDTGTEAFYDYLRAHCHPHAPSNALLLVPCLPSGGKVGREGHQPSETGNGGAALVDVSSKEEMQMLFNGRPFFIGESEVQWKALGYVDPGPGSLSVVAAAAQAAGEEAYDRLRCGLLVD
ncbi:hypothetical protein ADEAN_000430000 [Angomonas deanei]|uniref:RNA recognition motif. (A.k.a. RRM, RBD, or RNP domain) n=1 Tax=Angomonas deanei TaxID=59799 RepID=A0A7G2CFB3_9TRYP|nr:hypothetical protein ADEAN_000430000 [Angomonas deanei]